MRMLWTTGVFLCALMLPYGTLSAEEPAEKALTVKGVRYFSYPTFTRVVFEIEAAAPYVLTKSEDGSRLIFTAYEGPFTLTALLPAINDGVVKNLESKEDEGKSFIFVHLDAAAGEVKDFVLRSPDRIVLDITRGQAPRLVGEQAAPQTSPDLSGQATVVMLDPGHGGMDTGIVTAQGQEKAQTLELAFALRKLIKKKAPQLNVVLTREKDQARSLDERAALSNSARATLFLSLHVAPGRDMRVYIPEPDSEPVSQTTAMRRDFIGFEAVSEQQEMLWGRQQAAHIGESGRLGRRLMRQLTGRDGAEPVQAPLALLKLIDAAAVMVELGTEHDRSKAAEAIVKGIEQYVRENR